jgi:hypothetical protein
MASVNIYTGVWSAFTDEGVSQRILTLKLPEAGYLISGLALLVSVAGSSFWYPAAKLDQLFG